MFGFWKKPIQTRKTGTFWFNLSIISIARFLLFTWIRDTYIIPASPITGPVNQTAIWIVEVCLFTAMLQIPDSTITHIGTLIVEVVLGFISIIALTTIMCLLPEFLRMVIHTVSGHCMIICNLIKRPFSFASRMNWRRNRPFVLGNLASEGGRNPSSDFGQRHQTSINSSQNCQHDAKERLVQQNRIAVRRQSPTARRRNYSTTISGEVCRVTRSGLIYGRYSPVTRQEVSSNSSIGSGSANSALSQVSSLDSHCDFTSVRPSLNSEVGNRSSCPPLQGQRTQLPESFSGQVEMRSSTRSEGTFRTGSLGQSPQSRETHI